MFRELLAHDGVHEELELRSPFGLLAFHGGSLEKQTDDIASEVARRAGASLYAVVQPDDLRWHIPSKLIDPSASPALQMFLDHVEVGIAVHGYGREGMFTSLLLGGRRRDLATHIARHLRPRLPDYTIVEDVEAVPVELRGQHPDNPINVVRGGGVQLELPPRVRGLGPFWDGREERAEDGRRPHTAALIDGLVDAISAWAIEGSDAPT